MGAPDPVLVPPPDGAAVVRLLASREKATGRGLFPRVADGSPAAPLYEPIELSDEAVLYSYTVIHPSPKTGLPPVALGYVDFPEDVRVFGRLILTPGARPAIGMRLRPVPADDAGGYAFAPIDGDAA